MRSLLRPVLLTALAFAVVLFIVANATAFLTQVDEPAAGAADIGSPARPLGEPPYVRRLSPPTAATEADRLVAFRGLSTWIDVYDTQTSARDQVWAAARAGVQTVFVESAHYHSKPVEHPRRLAAIIEGAHDHGMTVMVWYVPGFDRLGRDYRRALTAMTFTTPRGDRADAFGLDIEVEEVADVRQRTARLLRLSRALRNAAGPEYPMAAIVLPPLQLDNRPSWWPDHPYAALADIYDVFIPMSYSSFRGTDAAFTYRWNLRNVQELRRRAGDATVPVHLAGGIADNLPAVDAFVRAAAKANVIGAGLYDLATTNPKDWATLRRLRSGDD